MEVPIKKQTILDLLPTLQNDPAFEIEVIRTLLRQLPALYKEELVRTEFLRVCREPYYILHTPYEGDHLFFTKSSLLDWCIRNVDPQCKLSVYEDWIFRGQPSKNRLVQALTVDYYNPKVQAFGNVHQKSRVMRSIQSGAMTIHTSGGSVESPLLVPVDSEDDAIKWYEEQIEQRIKDLQTLPPATSAEDKIKLAKEVDHLASSSVKRKPVKTKPETEKERLARRLAAVRRLDSRNKD